jgi:hypothetical protein
MELNISPGAMAALGCLVGVVLLSGVVLVGAWRRGLGRLPRSGRPPRDEGPSFTRAWKKEDAQLEELNQRARALKNKQKGQDQ